jgi:hypothetical protein
MYRFFPHARGAARMKLTKLQRFAQGQDCTLRIPGVCNHDPEKVVLCHLKGAGMATKTNDLLAVHARVPDEFKIEKFTQTLQGNIAYIHSINAEHASMLRKLLKAAQLLHASSRANVEGLLFQTIKTYKLKEPVETYLGRIRGILGLVTDTPSTEQVAV